MAGISARDRDIAIRNILAEALNQGDAGMEAVAQVMENRLNSGEYGDTLSDVVLQPGQFSAWNGITGYNGGRGANDLVSRDWSSGKDNQRYYEKAAAALDRVFGSSGDPTGGALNYYNPNYASPSWGRDASGTMIGDHKFLSSSKPTPLTPEGKYLGDDVSIGPVMPLGGLTGGTSFSTGGSIFDGGGGIFGGLLRGGAGLINAIPDVKIAAADGVNGLIAGTQPAVANTEKAVRNRIMENPIGALFNLGPFAGVFNGKGIGFGQSAAQQTADLAARSAANIKAAEGTGRRPITYSPHPENRTPSQDNIKINGIDIAFMPRSVQDSSRWNTGY